MTLRQNTQFVRESPSSSTTGSSISSSSDSDSDTTQSSGSEIEQTKQTKYLNHEQKKLTEKSVLLSKSIKSLKTQSQKPNVENEHHIQNLHNVQSKNVKKTPTKPKNSATVAPRTNIFPVNNHNKKRSIFSSDEDESSSNKKCNEKRTKKVLRSSISSSVTNSSDEDFRRQKTQSQLKKTIQSKNTPKIHDNSESDEKITRKTSQNHKKTKMLSETDSESDFEESRKSEAVQKRSIKKLVKRTKSSTSKSSSKTNSKSTTATKLKTDDRKCPSENCDSLGHLSGKLDRHFTLEACPKFHNLTIEKCKDLYLERKKKNEEYRKICENYKKMPSMQMHAEQKLHIQKIRDIRLKFKAEFNVNQSNGIVNHQELMLKKRELNLQNFVPEIDLNLFRSAQAIFSEKIERDLKQIPLLVSANCGTKFIELGRFEMKVWYQSPYPEDYSCIPKLYICEFCLRYMKSKMILQRHTIKCVWRHPPGDEVYRKDKISVWEVDGKRFKQFCQNLCLLAKFFLDHKTLYYDVEPFLFYVLTITDDEGCHTVGYFSKEKNSFLNYNVSCLLTLPPYQRQGFGRLLIDFSYLLTRVEGKIGSPEKPLSDLGLISYRSYWKDVVLAYLCSRPGTTLSIKDISQETAINSYDIVSTLQALGMMKYWKGKHIVLKKQDVLDEYMENVKKRGNSIKKIDETYLRWKPFIVQQQSTN